MTHFDAIVLGTGGVGSAALYHLARRGACVLGLDRFPPAHDRGSSHGQTRMIRQAYFEHPDYVPLVLNAYPLWTQLEHQAGRPLFQQTGLVQVGPADGPVLRGVLHSAARHGLDVEPLDHDEIERRWPALRIPAGHHGVFEGHAGILFVEACVAAHIDGALAAGAQLETGAAVRRWRRTGSGIEVETEQQTWTGDRLVIAAGAWSAGLLADVGLARALAIRRKPMFWYAASDRHYEAAGGCPAFLFELPAGIYYGIPKIDALGVKVAEHSGGQTVDDPLHVSRELDATDQQRMEAFRTAQLPGLSPTCTRHTVCMYTMTPDEHFIVDRHPANENVVFAAGLSGHGFKFTPVLGQALADLALDGQTDLPIGFLAATRASLTLPAE